MPARPATDAEALWLSVLIELENELALSIAADAAANATIDADAESVEATIDSAPDAAAQPAPASTGMWRAPSQMPALPDTLRARAATLHEQQLQREAELVAERAQLRKHLDALSVVPRPRSASASVYIDVAG